MDLSALADKIGDPQMQFYLCGPVAFMQFAAKQLVELGSIATTFITNASARIRCCKQTMDAGAQRRQCAIGSLNRRVVFFAGADTNHARDIEDKDLTVADFAGLRRTDNGIHAGVDDIIGDNDFDFHFRQKIDHILRAAIQLGMPLLAAKAFHFRYRHPGDADFGQRFTHVIQFERFNNRINLFHGVPVLVA
jgi:hypothetical protein